MQLCEGQKYYIKYGRWYLHLGPEEGHPWPQRIAQYTSPTAAGPETLAQWTIKHQERNAFTICNVWNPNMCFNAHSEGRFLDSNADSIFVTQGCGSCSPALFTLKDIGNGDVSLMVLNAHQWHPGYGGKYLRKPKDFGGYPIYLKFMGDPLAGEPDEQFRFMPV